MATAIWILGAVCMLATAGAPHDGPNITEMISQRDAATKIKRVYHLDTEATLVLRDGEAARLDFEGNSAGVKEFVLWFSNDTLHVYWKCLGQSYNSTILTDGQRDTRSISTTNAPKWMDCSTTWQLKDGDAHITFRARYTPDETKRRSEQRAERTRQAQLRAARRELQWNLTEQVEPFETLMHDANEPAPTRFRRQYELDKVVGAAADDYEALRRIAGWVHSRWTHHSDNEPSRPDPFTILEEAETGERFRCVEYATITVACAQALGMPARKLGLRREDADTASSGAGHVVAEVWLGSYGKWVLVDGQWDAIPELDGVPLNAVELQEAVAHNSAELTIRSSSKASKEDYILFIAPHLYYFVFGLDQRVFDGRGDDMNDARPPRDTRQVMLVPVGAKPLKVFQRKYPLRNCTYLSNPKVFYPSMSEAHAIRRLCPATAPTLGPTDARARGAAAPR